MKKLILSTILISISLSNAIAQNPQGRGGPPQETGDWKVRAGLGVIMRPEYEGSDEYEAWPIPYLDISYKDTFYLERTELGYRNNITDELSYSLGLGFSFGRDESDGEALRGQGDIDFGALAILGLKYDMLGTQLGVRFAQDISGIHDGFTVQGSIGKNWVLRKLRGFVNLSLNVEYGSEDYMQTYFGVNRDTNGNLLENPITVDAGIKTYGASFLFGKQLVGRWSIVALLNYNRFTGDLTDSPIVQSDDQIFSGLFLSRTF
jgi:outer membrane protein